MAHMFLLQMYLKATVSFLDSSMPLLQLEHSYLMVYKSLRYRYIRVKDDNFALLQVTPLFVPTAVDLLDVLFVTIVESLLFKRI